MCRGSACTIHGWQDKAACLIHLGRRFGHLMGRPRCPSVRSVGSWIDGQKVLVNLLDREVE